MLDGISLRSKIEPCMACSLHAVGRGPVPPEGNTTPGSVMLLGRNPGSEEDRVKRPFVGPSGQFLEAIIDKVGLKREDFYITNLCKCLSHRNAEPTKSEISSCANHLMEEILLVKPKLIVGFGQTVVDSISPGVKVSEKHGQIISGQWADILVMYHPGYIIRGITKETAKMFLDDFRNVLSYVKTN